MVSLPPPGIASRALTARLRITCSIWPGSALIVPRLEASAVRSSTSSPINRRSIFSRSETTVLRSMATGCKTCLRLKASSCRVRPAARSPAFLISSTLWRRGSWACNRLRTRSLYPLMAVSRLLKSCAMPPASCPMASSFCDCRSCSSRVLCSVISCLMAMKLVISPASFITGVMDCSSK